MSYHPWLKDLSKDHTKNIFLNIPYVEAFLSAEVAYWTTLTFFGLKPVFASDFRPTGARLKKIDALLRQCEFGISDLSISDRVGNIAFEMGYMVARGVTCQPFINQRFHTKGETTVMKFDEMMSDYKVVEPIIYDGNDIETLVKKLVTWTRDNPGLQKRKQQSLDSNTILTMCRLVEEQVRKEHTPERAERYARIKGMYSDILSDCMKASRSTPSLMDVRFTDHKLVIHTRPVKRTSKKK